MIMTDERSAWVTPLQWDGNAWSFSWGSFQDLEWAQRAAADRAAAFADRACLLQRLLRQNDRVVTLSDDTSILVYRRVESLDCIVVDSYPPIAVVRHARPATVAFPT